MVILDSNQSHFNMMMSNQHMSGTRSRIIAGNNNYENESRERSTTVMDDGMVGPFAFLFNSVELLL
jgi:hypothetical protein